MLREEPVAFLWSEAQGFLIVLLIVLASTCLARVRFKFGTGFELSPYRSPWTYVLSLAISSMITYLLVIKIDRVALGT